MAQGSTLWDSEFKGCPNRRMVRERESGEDCRNTFPIVVSSPTDI